MDFNGNFTKNVKNQFFVFMLGFEDNFLDFFIYQIYRSRLLIIVIQ